MLNRSRSARSALTAVASRRDILLLQEMTEHIHVSQPVEDYILDLVTATRTSSDTLLGSSPRGSIALYNAGRALALLRGRRYVIPEDIKTLAPAVLAHRLILTQNARLEDKTRETVLQQLLAVVPVPSAR